MLTGRRFYYTTGIAAIVLMLFLCAFVKNSADNEVFALAQREIMLRNAAHRLLLQSGDSTSRVLPVKQIGENEYQLQFEKPLSFKTDSLVAIVSKALAGSQQSPDYVVNVVGCKSPDVLFGYAIINNGKNSIRPCAGRKQPAGCYRINILFKNHTLPIKQTGYLVAGLPLLAFIGLLLFRPRKLKGHQAPTATEEVTNGAISIGNMILDTGKQCLVHSDKYITLTAKEYKLLYIFALSPNQVIPREELQKKIWEDEGVIVGRSLDMFISRLRKKLEADLSVKLINIHGKGFKLEVATS